MLVRLILGVIVVYAVLVLINAIMRRRVENLRDSGVYPLPGHETDADVDRLLVAGRKIDAIKVYRTVHGVGLKEAKEAVERRERSRSREQGYRPIE